MSEPIQPSEGRPVRFGDYMLHRLIGEGGMAEVYEGEELLSHRRVAVKVLRAEFANSDETRRRFLREMRILANLDDPNIVRCLLCTAIEGRPVMVLEHLPGWNLREMLNARVALPWAEVLSYAVQIARGLRTAHSLTPAIVHRDLKPENIMCLPDGRVKVMDFGIAKVLQSLSQTTNHQMGTLQYMSPEHIDAQPVDGRSDLFALGLLMWEMLAGHPPFQARSPRQLLDKICSEATPRLPDHARSGLPAPIEALIYGLLAKHPDGRPASAAQVLAVLEPFTAGALRPAPTKPRSGPGPGPATVALNTGDIAEGARRGPLEEAVHDQAARISDELSRFGQASSAWIVRVLLGLLIMPAGAVIFVGLPTALAEVSMLLLEDDGLDFEQIATPAWASPKLGLIIGCVVVVVFIRACWAHRRAATASVLRKPGLVCAGLTIGAWIAATGIELAPETSLNPAVHAWLLVLAFVCMVITLSWATGRLTSRLLRGLDRAGPRER